MAIDPKILESFNNIKNRIYKNDEPINRYDFQELAQVLSQTDWNEDELEALRALKRYVNGIRESVEDLGSKIVEIIKIDFSNKIRTEEFIQEILLIIDTFIDSLVMISEVIEFDESRINVAMSTARLKSLRSSMIQKINKYKRSTPGVTLSSDQTNFVKILVTDIIDSIIKESFKLQIRKLHEVLQKRIS